MQPSRRDNKIDRKSEAFIDPRVGSELVAWVGTIWDLTTRQRSMVLILALRWVVGPSDCLAVFVCI